MTAAPQSLNDMFAKLGEQLRIPSVDMTLIMEHHQKNLAAMTRSWQAMASGATAVAQKQREVLESSIREVSDMVRGYQPTGSPQEMFAKQAEFARRAMDAAIANTRDIADLMQKSGAEATRIIHDRMKESYDEIRSSVERK